MHQISIKENIRRIVKTNKFTKTLRPNFGLDRHIDKDMSLESLSYLKQDIYTQIKSYEPRVKLEMINFNATSKGLDIDLVYTLKETSVSENLRVTL